MKPLTNTVVHLPKKHSCPWHGVHIYFHGVQNGFGDYADIFYICEICRDDHRFAEDPKSILTIYSTSE